MGWTSVSSHSPFSVSVTVQDCGWTMPSPLLEKSVQSAGYHSLAADTDTIPEELKITALTTDGEVMAVQHKEYPVYGVQFHPESIMTPDGKRMLYNFIKEM